jgi:hypothetical protein
MPRLHPTLRLAPRALPRRKPLEVKNSLVNSELTATYCVRPLDLKERGIRKSINSYIGAGSLRGLAPFISRGYAAIEVMSRIAERRCTAVSSPVSPRERSSAAFDTIPHILSSFDQQETSRTPINKADPLLTVGFAVRELEDRGRRAGRGRKQGG